MSNNNTELVKSPLLVQPKAKKHSHFPKCYPFPIVRDSVEDNVGWNCIIGCLKNNCVEVVDETNMELLFKMGFFGKGTLSRSTPQVLEKKLLSDKGNKKKRKWRKSPDGQEKSLKTSGEAATTDCEGDEVLDFEADETSDEEEALDDVVSTKRLRKGDTECVVSDASDLEVKSDSSSDSICVTASNVQEKESLQLSFEEAFFLSYGLGVLVVKDRDQPCDLMRLWNIFCDLHDSQNFPVMYTAYHHFRSRGWIVRSGMKYGTDFALYKDGPPFYHASYTVVVKPVKEQNFRDMSVVGRPSLTTWSSLAGLTRINNHVSKDVIILYVIKPTTISENKISTPFCVSQYKLESFSLPTPNDVLQTLCMKSWCIGGFLPRTDAKSNLFTMKQGTNIKR